MNDPERPHFQVMRARPIAGPGISKEEEHNQSTELLNPVSFDVNESVAGASGQAATTEKRRARGKKSPQTHSSATPPPERALGRRGRSPLNLEVIREIIDLFEKLEPADRKRVLLAVNLLFGKRSA